MGAHWHRLNPGEPHRRSRGSGVEQPRASPVPARRIIQQSSWVLQPHEHPGVDCPYLHGGVHGRAQNRQGSHGRAGMAVTSKVAVLQRTLPTVRGRGLAMTARSESVRYTVAPTTGNLCTGTSNGPPTFGPSSVDSLPCWQGSTAKSEASGFRCADSGGQARSGKNP